MAGETHKPAPLWPAIDSFSIPCGHSYGRIHGSPSHRDVNRKIGAKWRASEQPLGPPIQSQQPHASRRPPSAPGPWWGCPCGGSEACISTFLQAPQASGPTDSEPVARFRPHYPSRPRHPDFIAAPSVVRTPPTTSNGPPTAHLESPLLCFSPSAPVSLSPLSSSAVARELRCSSLSASISSLDRERPRTSPRAA